MKKLITMAILLCGFSAVAQDNAAVTIKSVLLAQLKTTHNVKDWFVPATLAIAGLTPEQANWKDSSNNHSIAQLTTHLIFWNKQLLDKFEGRQPDAFSGDNKETFSPVDKETWVAAQKKLDQILTEWETYIEKTDDAVLMKWYDTISHIATHNAYHIGQILYIRKMKGWWDDKQGVQ